MPQLSAHSAATAKSAEILAQLSLESELAACTVVSLAKIAQLLLKLSRKIIDVNEK